MQYYHNDRTLCVYSEDYLRSWFEDQKAEFEDLAECDFDEWLESEEYTPVFNFYE